MAIIPMRQSTLHISEACRALDFAASCVQQVVSIGSAIGNGMFIFSPTQHETCTHLLAPVALKPTFECRCRRNVVLNVSEIEAKVREATGR